MRIGHVFSCFLLGHQYRGIGSREGHDEYLCTRCGHPLLLESSKNPHAGAKQFLKRARYQCNVFGHQVHQVCERLGFVEYACDCGHSFLKQEKGLRIVRHPLICTFLGHFIRQVVSRAGIFEYVCRNCGHTFCLTTEVS